MKLAVREIDVRLDREYNRMIWKQMQGLHNLKACIW